MADGSLSTLPSEIRVEIFKGCDREDLVYVSMCSKWLNEEVRPVLWSHVTVEWKELQKTANVTNETLRQRLKLTCHLQFQGKADEKWIGYLGFGYGFLMSCCDPERLKSLSIRDLIVPDSICLATELFPNLLSLELIHANGDLDFLKHFDHLTSLTIRGCQISRSQWSDICRMETLQTLFVPNCSGITCDQATKVSDFKLTSLSRLNLSGARANDKLLSVVSGTCTKLEFLDISRCHQVTDTGLACVSHLFLLKHLNISTCWSITDIGLYFISNLPRLEHLCMHGCDTLTVKGVQHVAKLKSLHHLMMNAFEDCSLADATDEDFHHIGDLTSLRTLYIEGFHRLTNKSLEVISKLTLLEELDIQECSELTVEGLVHLTKLTRLKTLKCSDVFEEEDLLSHGLPVIYSDQ